MRTPALRLLALAALAACALAPAGCSSSGSEPDRPLETATLLLDFAPNGVHTGIYSTVARSYDRAEGVTLRIRTPSASTGGVRQLLSGRARFAVLDIHDLAIARARGRDIVGVMAIVQRPLAAVIARPGIRSPRELEGRRVGVTGLPSDDAVLRSVVRGAGGDPAKIRSTTIGFSAVPALLSGRVAGATAFWSVEGVALRARRKGFREFRVDDFGAPAYPELVLAVTRATLQDRPAVVRATVDALRRGYAFALDDPESSVADLAGRVRGADPAAVLDQLDVLTSALVGASGRPGTLDPVVLRRWARWEARFGIVEKPPDVERAFETRFTRER